MHNGAIELILTFNFIMGIQDIIAPRMQNQESRKIQGTTTSFVGTT